VDRALLLAARGLRAFGFGFAAVLIGVHLERRGLPAGLIGLTLGVGLAAASLSGLASASLAARFGRRRVLAASGILMALTGLDLALANQPALLVLAGITGMLGAASVDLGPFASGPRGGGSRRQAQRRLRAVLADRRPVQRGGRSRGRSGDERRCHRGFLPSLCSDRRGDRCAAAVDDGKG
jgi:MFS family permease